MSTTPVHPAPPKASLHRVIVATGLVSLLTDLGSEMIYPLLPLLVTVQLGASRTMLGLIEGLSEGVPAVVRLFSGAISDRVRNRVKLIFGGYGLSSAAKPVIGLASSALQVLGLRIIDRIGKGIRGAPRDALVADYAGTHQRGHAFGYQRAMDHLGAMGGGLVSFALLSYAGMSVPAIFLVSAVPGVFTLLTILAFVRDKPDRLPRSSPSAGDSAPPPRGRAPIIAGLSPAGLPGRYRWFIAASTLFALANSTDAFLLLRAHDLGVAAAHLPLLWSALHLVKATSNLWGGRLSDRLGRRPLLATGWLLYAGVYLTAALGPTAPFMWVLFALYGVFFGLTEGAAKAMVADLAPPDRIGAAFGLLGLCEGLGLIAASVVAGVMWDAIGPSAPFAFGAACAIAATGVLWISAPKSLRSE